MTNLYRDLANAKDNLRRTKDIYETIRALAEMRVETTGKNADDRKREIIAALAYDDTYTEALVSLRNAERTVDLYQADIEAAESERREKEWAIRARLTEALEQLHIKQGEDDIDWHDLHFQTERRKFDAIQAQHERDLRDPVTRSQAQREMDELFTT